MKKGVREIEMRLLQPAGEAGRVGALLDLGALHADRGQERDGLRAAREALELASAAGDSAAVGRALSLAARCHFQRGDYLATVASAVDALSAFGDDHPYERSAVLRVVANALLVVEDPAHALSAVMHAVRLAAGGDATEAAAREAYGGVLSNRSRLHDARRELRRAGALYRRAGDRASRERITTEVAHTYRHQAEAAQKLGRPEQARLHWRRAARVYRAARALGRRVERDAAILHGLAECELALGDVDGAYEHAGIAVTLAEEAASPVTLAYARMLESRALQAMSRLQAAERACAHAVCAAEAARDEPLLIDCLRAHARLLDQLGRFQGGADLDDRARRLELQRKATLERMRMQLKPLLRRDPGEDDAIVRLDSRA